MRAEDTPRREAAATADAKPARPRAKAARWALYALAAAAGLFTAVWLMSRPDAPGPVDPARPPGSAATQATPTSLKLHPQPLSLPPLRFADGAGAPTSLAAFRGKFVLLNVWATWCTPCREEMPTLDRLQAMLGGPDFEVVALSIDQGGAPVVQDFFRQTGIKRLHPYMDLFGETTSALGVVGLPLTLLIDRQGREIARKLGPAVWDAPQIVELIRSRLGTSPSAVKASASAAPDFSAPPAHAGEAVTLTHVHGLSYSADGRQLMIPSHHGMAVYEGGRWSKAAGPAHDYMGFSATRDALYSSGHPAPDSKLPNPFGLIKSRDGGKSWQKLGLEGESDFHMLATSHATNAVYVLNHGPNSRMREAGIYYTLNDGLKWQRADAKGLPPKITSLAVHPTDAGLVAAGSDDGLYLSRNSAGGFERLVSGKQVLAASFDLNGEQLWFSTYSGEPALFRMSLKAGAKAEAVKLPALTKDAVAYVAQNPGRHSEIAIATFKRSVYLSKDLGGTWTQIAKEGSSHE